MSVEIDPYGIGQHDPGAKLDSGKPDASLLGYFGKALLEVSRVGTFGAQKYTRGGWQEVPDGINRYTAAMMRHFLQENENAYDDELGVLHAAQVAWNALARLELILREQKKGELKFEEVLPPGSILLYAPNEHSVGYDGGPIFNN